MEIQAKLCFILNVLHVVMQIVRNPKMFAGCEQLTCRAGSLIRRWHLSFQASDLDSFGMAFDEIWQSPAIRQRCFRVWVWWSWDAAVVGTIASAFREHFRDGAVSSSTSYTEWLFECAGTKSASAAYC